MAALLFTSDLALPALPSLQTSMRPLTASEAISPALERTQDLLLRPFRTGRFLKIAAVAFFSEIGAGFGLGGPGRIGNLPDIPPAAKAALVAAFLTIGIAAFLIGLVLFYLGSRLQLVMVELVATGQTAIAPLWRKYSHTTWRWIGLRLLFLLCFTILLLVLAAPFLISFLRHPPGPGTPLTSAFFAHIALFFAMLLPAVLLMVVVYVLLRDFALPSLALEDLPIAGALGRARDLLSAEPGQVALYVLLRCLLGVAAAIAGEILIVLTLLVSLIPFGILGGILWFALRNAGAGGTAILIGSGAVGGLLLFVWMACVTTAIFGSLFVFTQAYALYFLGGRYPLLGELLEPPMLPTSPPPPPLPYAGP